MTRASRWQLVNVDEDSLLRIAGIEGEHPLVNVFLETFAAETWGQSATRDTREQTSFDALSLGVTGPGDFLYNDTPFSFNIHSASGTAVNDVTRADVAFTAHPVALLVEFAFVVRVIEMFFGQ